MHTRLVLALAAALALSACGGDDSAPADTTPPPPAATSQPAPADTNPAASATPAPPTQAPVGGTGGMSADAIGVPECDTFLVRYERCMSRRVPEEMRGGMQTALESWRGSWSTLAAAPGSRDSLVQSCRTAEESARAQFVSYGCNF